MFTSLTKAASALTVTAALLVGVIGAGTVGTSAQAGPSCFGLEGQALSDCIDALLDELSDASNKGQSASGAAVATGFAAANTGKRVLVNRATVRK